MATVRLTRRGRFVLVLMVMMLLLAAAFMLGHGASAADRSHERPHTLIVKPGESLWAVAARVAPQQDPRLVVSAIESLNHLASPAVTPGQQLALPDFG
jgi:hypothetical protein